MLMFHVKDFAVGEEVKLLECEHCFHSPCIVPWLELHGTCPVCRKELGKTGESTDGESGVRTDNNGEENATAEAEAIRSENSQMPDIVSTPPAPGTSGGSAPSVSVTGPGGLTGLIQSALNQAFSLNWSSQPNSGTENLLPVYEHCCISYG